MTLQQQSELFLGIDNFLDTKLSLNTRIQQYDTKLLCRMVMKMEMTQYLINKENVTHEELAALGEVLFEFLYTRKGIVKLWEVTGFDLKVNSEKFPFQIALYNMEHYLHFNGQESNFNRTQRIRNWCNFMNLMMPEFFKNMNGKDPENTLQVFKGVFYNVQRENYFIQTNDFVIIFNWLMKQWKNENTLFSQDPAHRSASYLVRGSRAFIIKHPLSYERNTRDSQHS